MKRLIVVVGATGKQGGSVIDVLNQSEQWKIRGLTRNTASQRAQELISKGIEIKSCNIDSYDECVQAFDGAYGVFAMTNYWECGATKEYEQGLNLVKAAQQQRVQHFIWSSLPDTMSISNGKLDLPHYMMKARVESYIRNQQNPKLFPYPNAEFEFRVPLEPTARLPLYDVRDTGNIVAKCFENPTQWGQENVVPIVAEQLTMDEICETIRSITGNGKICFIPLTYDQCIGLTKEGIDNMKWYNDYGDVEDRHADKTKQVYNQMKTLKEWIHETKWLMDEKKN